MHQNSDHQLVVACLHYNGDLRGCLTRSEALTARGLADGFGNLDEHDKSETNQDMLWDWSHVRDSSPVAVYTMAAYLRAVLASKGVEVEVAA